MVVVYKAGPGAKNLPFVTGLTAKCAEETERALNSIIAELNALIGRAARGALPHRQWVGIPEP
eukprot:10553491-Lingulodinium_polyedra.AAC.1